MMIKIAYAGDRDISVRVLKFILDQGVNPLALIVPENATHSQELIQLCPHLEEEKILIGKDFLSKKGKKLLRNLNLDYIISIHFPHIYPKDVLEIPKHGVLNLHPAYLPYNRGWHTPTWAIWDETPYGATLHFMNEDLDKGDVIYQKIIDVYPYDTADTLYNRVKKLELEVFKEAWPLLTSFNYKRKPQSHPGTFHKKEDIKKLQFIEYNEKIKVADLLKKLRALTTNKIDEAAFFELNGRKYRVQIKIIPESEK